MIRNHVFIWQFDRYEVMLYCWDADPQRRPDFVQLTDIFEAMIKTDVDYLEVRSLMVTNRTYFGESVVVPAPVVSAPVVSAPVVPAPPQQFRDEEVTVPPGWGQLSDMGASEFAEI